MNGQVAQLVEQRTENPRVGGSIPPLATIFLNDGIPQRHPDRTDSGLMLLAAVTVLALHERQLQFSRSSYLFR
jgi:hypothetical protein